MPVKYLELAQQVRACAQGLGLPTSQPLVLAVSKTASIAEIDEAFAQGACCFGENRPLILAEKAQARPSYSWHFIGNIQSRQIPIIVTHADLIHSVYKPEHLAKIDAAASALGKTQRILAEVNICKEESKSGLEAAELLDFAFQAASYKNICLEGLMCMAPLGDMSAAQAGFEALEALRREVQTELEKADCPVNLHELSMGMTDDWQLALACGSTIVRIGRAIFAAS